MTSQITCLFNLKETNETTNVDLVGDCSEILENIPIEDIPWINPI